MAEELGMMKHAQTVRFGFRASLALVIAAVGYLLIRGSEHREPSPIEPEEHSARSHARVLQEIQDKRLALLANISKQADYLH